MALLTVPNSWGQIREDNDCHNPKGSPTGGQFCSKSGGKTTGGGKIDVDVEDSPHAREALTDLFGADADDILHRLGRQFQGDVKVSVAIGQQTGGLGIDIKDSAGNDMVQQFHRGEDGSIKVILGILRVAEQQKGLAKGVLREAMDVYEQVGVTEIALQANIDVGGYAWAKFGWVAEDPENFRAQVLVNVLNAGLSKAVRREVIDFVHSQKGPKLPWHVAGLSVNGNPIGKTLMLKTDWNAYLRLDDSEAMARFNHYVGR